MSMILPAATDATNVMPALALSVPVVITILAMRVFGVLLPANVIRLLTVAVAALIFQALVKAPVGWFIVTAPLIVKVPADWVSDCAAVAATNVSAVALLLLLIVTTALAAIDTVGKVVEP